MAEQQAFEDRIDERAVQSFRLMGFDEPLPDDLVEVYQRVKKRKDMIHPGPFSPEALALLPELVNRKQEAVTTGSHDGELMKGDDVVVRMPGKDVVTGKVTSIGDNGSIIRVSVDGDASKYREFPAEVVERKTAE